jgi:hypothetical protein
VHFTALAIAVLAVWEAVEIWHHSSLFASCRARVDLFDNWLGSLLRCPFCLAPWVSLPVVATIGAWDTATGWLHGLLWLLALPVIALAVARAANVCNDVLRRFSRTPKAGIPEYPGAVGNHPSGEQWP